MSLLNSVWAALGESADSLAGVERRGGDVPLDAVLPVGRFVHDAVAAAAVSLALLDRPDETPSVRLDPARIATAVTSERHMRIAGSRWAPWAELSGFWPVADGWVRTHANYPHHREPLLRALGLAEASRADQLRLALEGLSAAEVERRVVAVGGVATEVRTAENWRLHPHARAVDSQPIVRVEGLAPSSPRPAARPRVLDLTRVIAGPVATRTLALAGADVLRLDPPGLREIEAQHLDTGAGKRSALLNVDDARFAELIAEADVVVLGYRPGALEHYGLSPAELAERVPGIVVAQLSAWGTAGPLASRRGFDSIVQAATGISFLEGADRDPGALPAQALDHSAGYLLAAAVGSALRRRAQEGGSWLVETSLVRVAHELLGTPRDRGPVHPDFVPTTTRFGELEIAEPAPLWRGGPRTWLAGPVPWGSSDPVWEPRPA